ncbi:hypothetical protein C8J57DRAFT_1236679 [Mycena rebaudengoi]|nr:hypothetical protein C8J57DRAFT_1236679 [Mycena rebaudengoi]
MNLDGKHGFIGCQNYRPNERSHRFVTISRDVKEHLLRELLANDGKFTSDVAIESESAVCARVLHPRSGGKGARLCPYTYIDENHQVIQGKIIERKCGATIRIFSPLDRNDRRAIVYLSDPHNHPKFPSTKVSRKRKEVYREVIAAAGVTGLTVLKCDSAASMSKIFGGSIPAAFDPALANPRIKHSLIQEVKRVKSPYGLGIEELEIDEYSFDPQEFYFDTRKCAPFRTKNNISERLHRKTGKKLSSQCCRIWLSVSITQKPRSMTIHMPVFMDHGRSGRWCWAESGPRFSDEKLRSWSETYALYERSQHVLVLMLGVAVRTVAVGIARRPQPIKCDTTEKNVTVASRHEYIG